MDFDHDPSDTLAKAPPRAAAHGLPSPARPSGTQVLPSREVQHIWFELTRSRPWRSVAIIPVDDSASTFPVAHELAQMASLDPRTKLLLVNAASLMQEAMGGAAQPTAQPIAAGKYHVLDCAKQNLDETQVGMVEVPRVLEQMRANQGPFNMLMVATNSVLTSPAAVTTARAVDAVIICPTLGITTFADARRTLELVGAEQVAGSIAIRPRA